MAQLSIYIPDDLERELRKRAKSSGKSVSAVLTDLARRDLLPSRWPDGFSSLAGAWEGPFPEPEDPAPDEVEFAVHEPRTQARRRRR